jgi:hypothetical protein
MSAQPLAAEAASLIEWEISRLNRRRARGTLFKNGG